MQPRTLIVFVDGTWQDAEQDVPTNIVKLEALVKSRHLGRQQILKYIPGVGTGGLFDKLVGGGFGRGIRRQIAEGYRFLADNYQRGDRIALVGYSRGAYCVRSLAGMINKIGLVDWDKYAKGPGRSRSRLSEHQRDGHCNRFFRLYKDQPGAWTRYTGIAAADLPADGKVSPSHEAARHFRAAWSHAGVQGDVSSPIDLLCCFETVGSLGIPDWVLDKIDADWRDHYKARYNFHDTRLSKIIRYAAHALAIDELRQNFLPTVMDIDEDHNATVVDQTWFSGAHGIGGGANRDHSAPGEPVDNGLADIAGLWMGMQLEIAGIGLRAGWKQAFAPDPAAQPDNVFYTNLEQGAQSRRAVPQNNALHPSVAVRYDALPTYRPANVADRIPG